MNDDSEVATLTEIKRLARNWLACECEGGCDCCFERISKIEELAWRRLLDLELSTK